MTTRKPKSKKTGRPSKGARVALLLRIDPEILQGLSEYVAVTKEERSPCIQRVLMEHLMSKGFYPPKTIVSDITKKS